MSLPGRLGPNSTNAHIAAAARRFYEGACPLPRPSASRPLRPGASTSATRAPRCSTGCSRCARAAASSCASTTPIVERSRAEYADAIEADLAWLGVVPDLQCRQSERMALYEAAAETLRATGRLYPAYETAEELDRRRKRQQALGRPPIYDRAALRLTEKDRAALEAEGRRPHWRFRLEPTLVRWDDLVRGPSHIDCASLVRSRAQARGRHLSLHLAVGRRRHRSRASATSFAARTTSPTRRCRSRSSRRWRAARRPSATTICSPTRAAKGSPSARAPCRSRSLRESGVEALAAAALAVLVGSAESVHPVASLAELAASFDFSHLSHGAARFDEAELRALSARTLHLLAVRCRARAAGGAGDRRAARRAVLGRGARQSRRASRRRGSGGR